MMAWRRVAALLVAGVGLGLVGLLVGHGMPAVVAAPADTPTPGPAATPWSVTGRLGAFVQVADACSYYPLTTCDKAEMHVSEMPDASLKAYVGQYVRIELTTAVCGSSIAGRPVYGPVAVRVEPMAPCDGGGPQLCNYIQNKAPLAAIQAALANPTTVMGWGQLCNPAIMPGWFNGRRNHLSILKLGEPYHPQYNPLVYKCGCP
jgi:hypothetical protein